MDAVLSVVAELGGDGLALVAMLGSAGALVLVLHRVVQRIGLTLMGGDPGVSGGVGGFVEGVNRRGNHYLTEWRQPFDRYRD